MKDSNSVGGGVGKMLRLPDPPPPNIYFCNNPLSFIDTYATLLVWFANMLHESYLCFKNIIVVLYEIKYAYPTNRSQ